MVPKYVLLCMCLTAVTAMFQSHQRPGDDLDRDLAIIKKCNISSPVSKDIMNSVLINRILLDQNHYGFKCFLHCVYMEYGWMDHHGEFRLDLIKDFLRGTRLPGRTVRTLISMCTDSPSKDRCERAYDYTQCFWSELKKPQFDEFDDLEVGDYEPFARLSDED